MRLAGIGGLLILLVASFVLGAAAHKNSWPLYTVPRKLLHDMRGQQGPVAPGTRFELARTESVAAGADSEPDLDIAADQIAALEALGYAAGTQLAEPSTTDGVAPGAEPSLDVAKGYYLASGGQGPTAWLMDETGHVLHTWSKTYDEAFPGNQVPDATAGTAYYRRVALLPDGSLLAIFEGQGLIKLDAASNLQWALAERAHHDVEVQPDGTLYTLTRKAHIVDTVNPDKAILEDFVTHVAADGKVLKRISMVRAILNSPFRALVVNSKGHGDLFHTNSLEVLRETYGSKPPAFRAGNMLLSLRETHSIVVLDLDREQVVWALSGLTSRQHHPTMLPSGNMLVFDNFGDLRRSRVIEFDPATGLIEWEYSGAKHDFFTNCCGTTYMLPGGHVLMTEAGNGRALIVTRGGQTVWQYRTPHRVGKKGEYIATLNDVVKLPANQDLSWLPKPPG